MAKVMTKAATVGHLADKAGLTKKQVIGIIDEIQTLAVKEAKKNGAFVLPGIGKVVLSNRKARNSLTMATAGRSKASPTSRRCSAARWTPPGRAPRPLPV